MSYRIAIPSYQRSELLVSKTLVTLSTLDVDPALVDIFVANEEEAEVYRRIVPDRFEHIIVGVRGMMPIRRFIHQHYPEDFPIVSIDDDIAGLYAKYDDKTYYPLAPSDWELMVEQGFNECWHSGARLWGIYPVLNAMFMKHNVTRDLRYIVGAFWGCINSHDEDRWGTQEYKEDFERSIRWYHKDRSVVRLNNVAPKTSYFHTPGGMQVERTPEKEEMGARALAREWPQYCSLNTTKKSGFMEVRLRDKTRSPRTVLT